ncbi:MAG TPA: hypothetical protein VFZ25_20115 [Chloroflexota bacterium]|nr:hypothetical protein [Chloroflexota bacterium]
MGINVSAPGDSGNWHPPVRAIDEARIRRAIRQLISSCRLDDGRAEMQYVFDLLGYLSPEAQVIVDDEVAHTFAELVGSI